MSYNIMNINFFTKIQHTHDFMIYSEQCWQAVHVSDVPGRGAGRGALGHNKRKRRCNDFDDPFGD